MGAVFITATGTDVGKTFVTAGLIRHLHTEKKSVTALKPVMSGYDPAISKDSDAGVLLQALGRDISETEIAAISPWRYLAALSPDMAAAREGKTLDVDALIAFCRKQMENETPLLIEGVGGVMVPLDARRTVLDWMVALACPVILVTGSYLGAISHTLGALEVLKLSNLDVRALVVSETDGSTVPLAETVDTLTRFGKGIDIVTLPRMKTPDAQHPAFAQITDLLRL